MSNRNTLGSEQRGFLRSMREYGSFHGGCGWIWKNQSTSIRLAEALVKRGFATRETQTIPTLLGQTKTRIVYRPTNKTEDAE